MTLPDEIQAAEDHLAALRAERKRRVREFVAAGGTQLQAATLFGISQSNVRYLLSSMSDPRPPRDAP